MLKFALALLLASLLCVGSMGAMYEDAKLDLIILMDRSGSIAQADYEKMLNVIEQLPSVFPIDKEKTQVAMITFDTNAKVVHDLMGDVDRFKREIAQLRLASTEGFTSTHKGLEKVQTDVQAYDQRPEVTNVLIILTDGCTNPQPDKGNEGEETMKARQEAEDRAAQLRSEGVIIFLVHVGQVRCAMASENHQLNLVGGDPKKWVKIDNFDELTTKIFEQVGEQVTDELCRYKKLCYYQSEQKSECVGGWWRPHSASVQKCKKKKPDTVPECEMQDCRGECDTFAKEPDKKCEKYCQKPKHIVCVACQRCAMPGPPQPTRPAIRGGSVVPVPVPEEKSREGLYIGLGVGLLLLVLLLLILAIVVVQRRRKAKKRLAMEAAIYEKAKGSRSMSKWGATKRAAYKTMPLSSFAASQATGPGYRLTSTKDSVTTYKVGSRTPKTGPAYQLTSEAAKSGYKGATQSGPGYRLTTAIGGGTANQNAGYQGAVVGAVNQSGPAYRLTTAIGGGTATPSAAGRDTGTSAFNTETAGHGQVGVSMTSKETSREVKRSIPERTRSTSREAKHGKRRPHSRTIGRSKQKAASRTVDTRR